jgi:hypothetical protein
MNSDNFDFAKSSEPQSIDAYSSYADKQFSYINDINNGVYANNSGLTQVQFDLSSIYNSASLTNSTDAYLTIPIVMTAVCVTSAGVPVTLPVASLGLGTSTQSFGFAGYSLCALKTNYQHLIHQIEVQADGKTINETQPFTNIIQHFRMLSQMSTTDLNTWGPSLNFNKELDNEKSLCFNKTPIPLPPATNLLPLPATGFASVVSGNGISNNIPYLPTSGSSTQSASSAIQNTGCVNTAIANRLSRFADVSTTDAGSNNNLYGTGTVNDVRIMSATQLANEYKPIFSYVGNVLYWQDVAIIPMKYLCDVFDKLGLVRKLSAVMRLYLNTGSISVPVSNATLSNQFFGKPTNSTFTNTCPFTINNVIGRTLGTTVSTTGENAASVPLNTSFVCAGVFVARAPTTAIPVGGGSINIGLSVPSHPMPSCRTYFSTIKLSPAKEEMYITQNRNKVVVYEQFITNQYNNISAGSSFSQLVQSGIRNPIAIAIIPLISASQLVNAVPLGFNQYGSCLDTCPATFSPISLTNLAVSLGNTQVLNTTLFYTFENFLEQVGMADNLTSSDLGLGAGLISQSYWENACRVYYVDLKRSRDADKMAVRNLQISFNNNSSVAIDLLVFTLYLDKLVVDVETGLIKKV